MGCSQRIQSGVLALLAVTGAPAQTVLIEADVAGENNEYYEEVSGAWIEDDAPLRGDGIKEGMRARAVRAAAGNLAGTVAFTPVLPLPGTYTVDIIYPETANARAVTMTLEGDNYQESRAITVGQFPNEWLRVGEIPVGSAEDVTLRFFLGSSEMPFTPARPYAFAIGAARFSLDSPQANLALMPAGNDSPTPMTAPPGDVASPFDAPASSVPESPFDEAPPEPVQSPFSAPGRAPAADPFEAPGRTTLRDPASEGAVISEEMVQQPVAIGSPPSAAPASMARALPPARLHASLAAAKAAAVQSGRPVLLLFSGDNFASEQFESILATDRVRSELARFEFVRLDYRDNRPLARRYAVDRYPYTVVLNPAGYTVGHVAPILEPDELARELTTYTQSISF